MSPSLDVLRQAYRVAEESEHAAQRTMGDVMDRLDKLRQQIQHNGAVRRTAADTAAVDDVRRRLEELERERADAVQEKVRCTEVLEKARRRTREAKKAWNDAELRVGKLRAQIPQQERVVARHKQAVAEAEYELERRRNLLREEERTLDLLQRELDEVAGE